MSQPETMSPSRGAGATPNLGKNLFWDDVRIGLNLLVYGVVFLLIGAVAGPGALPAWVQVLATLAGGVVTVLGIKVCAHIPAESGVSFPAQGAFMAAALCFVTVIINYFGNWQWV